jgi:uncharacterized protein YkwD
MTDRRSRVQRQEGRLRRICFLTGLVLSMLTPVLTSADTVDAVNDIRLQGCRGRTATMPGLHENARLDEAARRLSRGDNLHEATAAAGYRAIDSTSVHITNVPHDRDLALMMERQFCSRVMAGDLQDIGAYRRGADVWLVMAAPFSPPSPRQQGEIAHRVLELTNQARSQARRCGNVALPAAPPLTQAPALEQAALEHSRDMAANDYLAHGGRDGSTPAERLTRTGYRWRIVGENLASGVLTPEEAVKGWIASPPHCENLMSSRFSQMGAAYAVNASSAGGIFWTQVFAAPH